MKFFCYLSLTLFTLVSCVNESILEKKSLRATNELESSWQFRQVGKEQWYSATVPGVVHTDLLANKSIEDPYISTNEKDLQWIENESWEYKTTFNLTAKQLESPALYLNFEGLDTYAKVYLNDMLILNADNMFVEWRVDIIPCAKEGANTMRVVFESAYLRGIELAKLYPKLPADNDKGVDYKTSVFTRKAPYHFGWDWGPRFLTAGIWKPIFIDEMPSMIIDNVQYIQESQTDTLATFTAKVTLEVINATAGKVVLLDSVGNEYAATLVDSLKVGENIIFIPFSIKNPKLWWPAGMNQPKPTLYDLNAVLIGADDAVYDKTHDRLGVRTVELVREKDAAGESFFFKVNGEPLFMKGANIIPQDMFLPNVTKERYHKLVDIAVESNMNMLRVWGGGIYEDDDFYDYCDEQGVMIWQDFIFACSFYPWDEQFYDSVREEARQNVRRLRNHPSLAVWCGNNEIDEAWHRWGYKENAKDYPWSVEDKKNIRKGIDDLFFDKVLPGVLEQEDTTRPYHPSSPLYGWGDSRSQHSGDVHYWGVFHGEEPFSVYKDKPGRFSNEYGHQSLAGYDTWKRWFNDDDMVYLSEAFKVHQKNPKGYRVIKDYMSREVKFDTTDLRDYIYKSQLVQADGIRIAMEGHRQNRPFTMGSLFWQLNDCWPVTSWSSMDYPYNYKALQFFAIHSFAPTILSFNFMDKEQRVELWGITDELTDKKGNYELSLIEMKSGNVFWSEKRVFDIPANTSVELVNKSVKELLDGKSAKDYVLKLVYNIEGGESFSKMFYFLPYKDINFPAPKFDIEYVQKGNKVEVTITANTLLKAVLLESDVLQSENPTDAYFDMYPGESKVITLTFDKVYTLEELNLRVKSLV